MYEVYLDGKLLYYPGDEVNALSSAVLNTKLNDSGTLEITIPTTNPLHDKYKQRISELTVKKNGKEIWNGEIRSSKSDFKKQNVVKAVGELSYLTASSQPQKKYSNVNALQIFTSIINEHNAQVEPRKQFEVGIVAVGSYNYDWITNYEDTLEFMRIELCEKLNGYLRIRKVDGKRYLDLVSIKDYGKSCTQPIEFGENLLDYANGITADSIATVLRPLGATLENGKIDGVNSYVTIESVNNGKDYLENKEAIESGIGYVWRTVHFNDLTDPVAVKTAGENWLQDNQFSKMTIDVTAVDLSDLNSNIESFDLGDSVRTIAKPFGMDRWSYITQRKVDLLNPVTKHNISIGESVRKSYTQQIASENSTIKREMPQQAALLDLAKNNASELIKNATEGNIFTVYDENGNPKELLIMDTNDIKTAKKVWRWNVNGLGYSSTGYNGEYGLAMTMDGAIVADVITTGILRSIEINNGNGKFNVDTYGNVTANSFKSNNANITGGNLKINKQVDFDFGVLTIESNRYMVNFTSRSLEIFDKESGIFSDVNLYGTYMGTFSGRPHTDGFIAYYNGSTYGSSANIVGNLSVSGTKSRIADTKDYGERFLYCYETSSPMFGDIGEGVIDETGKCYVFLDDIFAETVDTDCTYQVFLQPYGKGTCFVEERTSAYFVVAGTENLKFGWEIKCIQKDYDTIRLEEPIENESDKVQETLSDTSIYLNSLLYSVEGEEFGNEEY